MAFTAEEAALWCGGAWTRPPPAALCGVSTDTRKPAPGALFIALRGERFDGHGHIAQAFKGGAAAVLVDEAFVRQAGSAAVSQLPALVAWDTRAALSALAAGWLARVAPRVIGVTGSAGKTTTKEWTAAMLSGAMPAHKTPGNFNNAVGLPLSILSMPEDARAAVLEIGTNHPGEIAPLAALMRPECAIITNIGPAHIGAFGSLDAIADEKAALLRALPRHGSAFLDADSPHFARLAAQAPCRVACVSRLAAQGADYTAADADEKSGSFTVFEKSSGDLRRIATGQSGAHNITNALLALAAARFLGAPWRCVEGAVARLPALDKRWEKTERGGVGFISDCYNANPQSMGAALERFALEPCAGRKIAVLGDMLELGGFSEAAHRAAGAAAAAAGADILLAVGGMASRWLADGAAAAGMAPRKIHACADAQAARAAFAALARPGDLALLKASRAVGLEALTK